MTNQNEKRKVPELRFPEFSGEWKENKLKDLTLLIKDGSHGTHKDVETGPWLLSAKNIKNNKINIDNNDRKISIDDYETIYRNYTLLKNDILLSIVGTIGRTALVENEENIAFQRSVAIIRPNKILTSTFLIQLMNGKRFQKDLKKYQVISAQPGIYLGDLNKLSISFPDKNEQQKIGEFFSKLDRQIELEEKKLALLEEQKKGYMQKIFSQELRFKDENGEEYPEWEKKLIKNIAKTYSGGTPDSKNSNYYNGNIPFIRSGEINKYITELNVNELAIRSSSARLVEKGDILYALYGATSGEVSISKINGAINQAVLCIKTNQDNFYVYSFLVNNKVSIVNRYIQGGQGNLSANIINNLIIQLPIKTEQIKISGLLSTLDNKIECSKRKIVIRKKLKLAYLGKIFI